MTPPDRPAKTASAAKAARPVRPRRATMDAKPVAVHPVREAVRELRDKAVGRTDVHRDAYAWIAAQVAQQRMARGMSQLDLAKLCGTTQSAIARLESGKRPPRIDTLLTIADALGCDVRVELTDRPSR